MQIILEHSARANVGNCFPVLKGMLKQDTEEEKRQGQKKKGKARRTKTRSRGRQIQERAGLQMGRKTEKTCMSMKLCVLSCVCERSNFTDSAEQKVCSLSPPLFSQRAAAILGYLLDCFSVGCSAFLECCCLCLISSHV